MEQVRAPRPEKVEMAALLAGKISGAKGMFLADYSGLSVADITELRRKFRENDVEFLVVKNTLARLGAKQAGQDEILPYLQGPTAVAISTDDPAAPARVIKDFLKTHKRPEVKACVIEGDVMPGEAVQEIAEWPSREELIARVVRAINAPVTGFVMALAGIEKKLLYVLNAIAEKKGGE